MNTTEFEKLNRKKGIIGPDPQEIEELNRFTNPKGKSRFDNLFRGVAAVLGFAGSGAVLEACAPPQQTETRPVQVSSTEIVKLKPSIQVTYYESSNIPASLNQELSAQFKTPTEKATKIVAINPTNQPGKVEIDFAQTTNNGRKDFVVMFPKDQKYVLSDYRMVVTADKDQKAHLEYVTPDNRSFIDIGLNLSVPAKIDGQFTDEVLKASEDIEKIEVIKISNLATNEQVAFKKADKDIFRQLLQAFSPKQAYAESLPPPTATPTPTKTPEPTITATVEPTKTPPKEKPASLTAENFSEFVGTVPNEEFQRLAKSQPDNFAFPLKPIGEEFKMSYKDIPSQSPATKGNYKTASISGSDIKIFSPIDGEIIIRRDNYVDKNKITSIHIRRKISENTSLLVSISIATDNSTIISLINNTSSTERGSLLVKASGIVGVDISLQEILAEWIIINRPDGGITEIGGYATYLTPSIFESSGWISKDNKAVTSQD